MDDRVLDIRVFTKSSQFVCFANVKDIIGQKKLLKLSNWGTIFTRSSQFVCFAKDKDIIGQTLELRTQLESQPPLFNPTSVSNVDEQFHLQPVTAIALLLPITSRTYNLALRLTNNNSNSFIILIPFARHRIRMQATRHPRGRTEPTIRSRSRTGHLKIMYTKRIIMAGRETNSNMHTPLHWPSSIFVLTAVANIV